MKHVVRVAAHWALLAHIYISMAGLTLAVLFGLTGLALNHQDFGFSNPRITKSEIVLDKNLVAHTNQAAMEDHLREKLGIRSPSTDYHDDADQIQVTYAAPGARTVVTIVFSQSGSGLVPASDIGSVMFSSALSVGIRL